MARSSRRRGCEDAGGVDQHDLGVALHGHAAHREAGGLHLLGDDGDLGADQAVDQGRLAGVGRADDGGEAGAGGQCRSLRAPRVPAWPAAAAFSASWRSGPGRGRARAARRVTSTVKIGAWSGPVAARPPHRRGSGRPLALRPFLQLGLGIAWRRRVEPARTPRPRSVAKNVARRAPGRRRGRARRSAPRRRRPGRCRCRARRPCWRSPPTSAARRGRPMRAGDPGAGVAVDQAVHALGQLALRARRDRAPSAARRRSRPSTRSPRNSSRSLWRTVRWRRRRRWRGSGRARAGRGRRSRGRGARSQLGDRRGPRRSSAALTCRMWKNRLGRASVNQVQGLNSEAPRLPGRTG